MEAIDESRKIGLKSGHLSGAVISRTPGEVISKGKLQIAEKYVTYDIKKMRT